MFVEGAAISTALAFVETELFEATRRELISDEEFRQFQCEIIRNPEAGRLIVGTGGLRKVRLAPEDGGKSGGFRVIYLLVLPDTVYLMLLYKKGRKDTLSSEEKKELKKLSTTIKAEHTK